MGLFRFKATDNDGCFRTNVICATDRDGAIVAVRDMGWFPTEVVEVPVKDVPDNPGDAVTTPMKRVFRIGRYRVGFWREGE